jgi:hypothetical protein
VGGKMNSLNEKKKKHDFLRSTIPTLLSQIKENSVNAIFFKFIISVMGDHFDFSPRAPKNLATPLTRRKTVSP